MTEHRQSESAPHMRISFPVFSDEKNPAHAEEMNAFYRAFREAAADCARSLNTPVRDGTRMLLAEYKAIPTPGGFTVIYRLTVRHRGRILSEKRYTHVWENGTLVPARGKYISCCLPETASTVRRAGACSRRSKKRNGT